MNITFVVDGKTQSFNTKSNKYKIDTTLSARIERPASNSEEYDFDSDKCKVIIVTPPSGNSVIEILREKAFPTGTYTLDVENKKIIKDTVGVADPNADKRTAKEDPSALSQPDIIRSLGALIDNINFIVENSNENDPYKTAVNNNIDDIFKPGIVGDPSRGGRESFVEIDDDKLPEAITSQQVIGSLRDPTAGVPYYIDTEMTGNSSLTNFLKAYAGRSEDPALAVKLLDAADLSTIADNFEKLLTYLGIKDVANTVINEFDPDKLASDVKQSGESTAAATAGATPAEAAIAAAKGAAEQVKAGVAAATSAVTSAAAAASGASGSSAGTAGTTTSAAASDDEDVEEEPAPESAPGQTIGFYVMIFGADKGTDAEIEIEFLRKPPDGSETIHKIMPIKGSMLGKNLGIHVDDDDLIALWKANNSQEAAVRIKAVPATGGDAVVVEERILIRWPLYKDVNSPPLLKFRFSETTGTRTYTGLAAREGSGGAKNDRDKEADVAELYYTKSGGIKKSTIGTTVDAVGSTYRFTFDVRPMLVPIEIDVPEGTNLTERKKLSEGAVPHWIFLSGRSAGRDSSGSAGVSGAGKKAVNIAVSRFAIKTKGAWIAVPNVGTPWDKGTFRVDIADNAGGAGPDDKKAAGLAPILGIAEINKMNLDKRAIENAVREALFGSSAAWSKLGISDNCWAKDPSVSGTGGVTRREITYNVGASA